MGVQSRNQLIDTVKGVAIILVVVGHCIQSGCGAWYSSNNLYWENVVFKFIYGFHMPLFAMVSGYLFFYSIQKRSLWGIVCQRVMTIGVPIVVWSGIMLVVDYGTVAFNSVGNFLSYYRVELGSQLWFLWALLGCSFLIIGIRYFLKDSVIAYMVFFVVSPFLSDAHYLGAVKFLYPYFVFGYLVHRFHVWNIMKESFWEHKKYIVPISALLYAALLLLFHQDTYFYTTGITILGKKNVWDQFWNDGVRLMAGFIGCILTIGCMAYLIYIEGEIYGRMIDLLARVGQYTMGIYIINVQTVPLMQRITQDLSGSIGLVAVETVIMMLICWGAAELLYRMKGGGIWFAIR